jgi:RNA polymerase sigma factor (TIGR02999 family)
VSSPSANLNSPDPTHDAQRVELTTTLYGELHRLAAARMWGQPAPQTLQATALVHEAWLRLGGAKQPQWKNRRHYFAAVAEAMRRILIDRARRRQSLRRGGEYQRIDLDTWNWERLDPDQIEPQDEALLVLHEALQEMEKIHPEEAALVKLRFFAGLGSKEAADAMGWAERTAARRLAFARAWLNRTIRRELSA